MKILRTLREKYCFTFLNMSKTSPLIKNSLKDAQITVIFESLKEFMKQQKREIHKLLSLT